MDIKYDGFSRISSGAFNVDNFDRIEICGTNISVIEDNAFYSDNTLDNDLILDLKDNRLLSGHSFAPKAFSNIRKPTKFYLADQYWNILLQTPITYLPEKTFLPFLQMSDNNRIELSEFHLDCNDCRNAWLKNNPNQLNKVMIVKNKLTDNDLPQSTCNNEKLKDKDNFNNCTIKNYY